MVTSGYDPDEENNDEDIRYFKRRNAFKSNKLLLFINLDTSKKKKLRKEPARITKIFEDKMDNLNSNVTENSNSSIKF